MPKKIIVDCCEHCYLKEIITPRKDTIAGSHSVVICINPPTYGMFLDNLLLIPDWCKLEDN